MKLANVYFQSLETPTFFITTLEKIIFKVVNKTKIIGVGFTR